jgi:hypothetical protein
LNGEEVESNGGRLHFVTDIVKQCNNISEVMECTDYYMLDMYAEQSNVQYRERWEQTRFVSYITAQCQSSKKLKIEDIMAFPWDTKQKRRKTVALPEEKKREMLEKMKKVTEVTEFQDFQN